MKKDGNGNLVREGDQSETAKVCLSIKRTMESRHPVGVVVGKSHVLMIC